MSVAPHAVRWISSSEAARLMNRSYITARRILDAAGVGRQDLPGTPPRWNEDEILRLVETSVRRPGGANR